MKQQILLLCFGIACWQMAGAQARDKDCNCETNNSGLMLGVGAAATYYYGPSSRNFEKFENDRVNWQLNGMLGITITRGKNGRRTMLAGFGTYGFNNRNTITHILTDQDYVSLAPTQSGSNNYYQYEGGLIIAEVLRLSTGVGQQNITEQALTSADGIRPNARYLKYYSSTAGLNINLGSVTWLINCNFAYGKDFNNTVLTPNTGLMLRF